MFIDFYYIIMSIYENILTYYANTGSSKKAKSFTMLLPQKWKPEEISKEHL